VQIVAYRTEGCVAVEVPGVVDYQLRQDLTRTLLGHLRRCEEPRLVVHLYDPLLTATAVNVLCELQRAARARQVDLRVVVHPVAERILRLTGLDHLLAEQPPSPAVSRGDAEDPRPPAGRCSR
jgi:anti-anti-sigma regulatory factor